MEQEQDPNHDVRDWNELVRRINQLGSDEGQDGLVGFSIPASDPTGALELMQTMRSRQIEESQRVSREFPFYHSLFCSVLPHQAGYLDAERAVEAKIQEAFAWAEANFERGVDFVVLSLVAGEVTAFNFRTEEMLGQFRAALNLDAPNETEG